MKSVIFPANLIHIHKSISTFISETKGLEFYSSVKPMGDLIFESIQNESPIFIENLEIYDSKVRIKSSNLLFNISKMELHDSTLDMDNANISSRRIALFYHSYLTCCKLDVGVIVFNYIDNRLVPLRLEPLSPNLFLIYLDANESINYVFCKMKNRDLFDVHKPIVHVQNDIFDTEQRFKYDVNNEKYVIELKYKKPVLLHKIYVAEEGSLEFLDGTRYGINEFKQVFPGIDYSWKPFQLVIWDEYEEPFVIDHFSPRRRQFNITSRHKTNTVYFTSNEEFSYLYLTNLTLKNPNNVKLNISNCIIRDCLLDPDVRFIGNSFQIRDSNVITHNINVEKLFFYMSGDNLQIFRESVYDEKNTIFFSGHNYISTDASNLTFNESSRFTRFSNQFISKDICLYSDADIGNLALNVNGKVFMDFTIFPIIFSVQFNELIMKNYTEIRPQTELTILSLFSLNYQGHDTIKFKKVSLEQHAVIINSNVLIDTERLEMSAQTNLPTNQTIKCKTLAIYSDTFSDLKDVFGVETIEIHYSLFKCGFINIKKLTAANYNHLDVQKVTKINDKPVVIDVKYKDGDFKRSEDGGLHVKFINDNVQDQFFYDGDWDDFSLDLICFQELEVNFDELSYEFNSNHWNFNGSSRVFDMKLIKRNGKSCFSLVHMDSLLTPTPVSNKKSTMTIIIISSVAGLMAIIIGIAALLLIRSHRKKINRFIFERHTEMTESLMGTDVAEVSP
ncbi:hypothetical protein TVAG_146630 [Trichomonas vaginalis G3]|uniref:Uncharacterized protein n=1 Tax=Trichomonas vaginalis (strain ATCC PRA-98 / G3) TaxID=412133 RepID=A2DKW7_TRIV3|nr:hypothetical protein TVAGG3_0361620 [Trichomonas vaginalis G3]EAY18920.1 hypothetical protein TVAG_146630 [Trichomonas vaginalis G3]KAI5531981.1 hypothetical protein TVAGG3_0361620 [Trichomonas vaginalis G3]|eukprot:XP_001579906.1 hypothetical protein [Trichomonas vaginalis G3]